MGVRLPAFRLVKDGETLPPNRYTKTTRTGSQQATGVIDAAAVFDEFAAGATIVFQSMHRSWAPLAEYCRLLELALGHPVQANAYITPPGAQGFGAHEDEHDVFVLQSHGAKQWSVYDRHDLAASSPPLIDLVLTPGDSLYIPEGFPHAASTQERESVHITIGVLAVRWSTALTEAVRALESDPSLHEPLPLRFTEDAGFADQVGLRLRHVAESMTALDASAIARTLRRRVLTTRQSLLRGQLQRNLDLDDVGEATAVARREGSFCVLGMADGELSVLLGDRELRMPLWVEPAMTLIADGAAITVADLPGLDEAGRLVLVRRLIREGLLEVVA